MIKLPPLPYQINILKYMSSYDQFALLGDPGIGKTYIMLNTIESKNYQKVLVICPKCVMDTAWGDDIPNMTDFTYKIIWDKDFSKRSAMFGNERIHIINYDVVSRLYKDILAQNYDCIILDESTFVKTHNSKRTKACHKLIRHIKNRYILTGTVGYKVDKIWAMFYFVDPRTWDGMNFYQFREKYFFKIESGGIPMYFFNKKYTEEINARIFRKGLRVLKSEVQKYLPEKIFIKHLLDMPQKAKDIYDTFDEHGVCGDIFTFFSIVQRTKLMQMANGSIINDQMGQDKEIIFLHDVKLKEVDRLLEDEIPQEEQVIIWANFEEDFAKLHELTGYPMICGGVNYKQTVRDFKDGKIKGIIAHPKSISWGVTFIKCHYNIYYGLPDDLECFSQSLDRCHRQGQKNNVTIYLLLCRDTIDEAILKIHEKNKTLENTLSYDDTLKSSNFRILVGSNLI